MGFKITKKKSNSRIEMLKLEQTLKQLSETCQNCKDEIDKLERDGHE